MKQLLINPYLVKYAVCWGYGDLHPGPVEISPVDFPQTPLFLSLRLNFNEKSMLKLKQQSYIKKLTF